MILTTEAAPGRERTAVEYIYETHLHTIEGSACSNAPAKDYIERMMKIGYSGMIVTDHFFNGNTAVPRELPWNEWVELYCKGYEHALEAAEGKDFTVLFGIEYCYEGDEYLVYGIDKQWLLDRPNVLKLSRQELYDEVHRTGGLMLQAHPYRERGYLKAIHLAPNCVDGSEGFNAGNPDYQNALCYQYGLEQGFLMSGGSDIHHINDTFLGGTSFPYKINTIQDFVKAFKAGDGIPVYIRDADAPDAKFLPVSECPELTTPDKEPSLPVIWH